MASSGSESHSGGSRIKGSTKASRRGRSVQSFIESMKNSFTDVPF